MCSQSWQSLHSIQLQLKFNYEENYTCETFLHFLFPKGRNVGGSCYRPYHSLPEIKLATFTVLPNAHHDSAWSEKYCRIPNTITSRKKWIGVPWLPCFIIALRLSCFYAFNHKNENLPKPLKHEPASGIIFLCSRVCDRTRIISSGICSFPTLNVAAHPILHSWPCPSGNCLYWNKLREY